MKCLWHYEWVKLPNVKEYVEAIECFAYSVLIEKSIINNGYFAE